MSSSFPDFQIIGWFSISKINEIVLQEKEREIDEELENASDQLQRSFTTEEAMLRRVPNK